MNPITPVIRSSYNFVLTDMRFISFDFKLFCFTIFRFILFYLFYVMLLFITFYVIYFILIHCFPFPSISFLFELVETLICNVSHSGFIDL